MEVDGAHFFWDYGPIEASLLLLAGGDSSRMGRPKPLLEIGPLSLAEYVVARLASEFDEVLISAREPAQVPEALRARFVPDRRPAAGPLAGIEAGLLAASHDTLMVVAADMPWVTIQVARLAVAAAAGHDAGVPISGGRPQPVCAAYRKSAVAVVGRALDAGRRRLQDVLSELDVAYLSEIQLERAGIGPATFRSLNTPADHREFLDAMRHSG